MAHTEFFLLYAAENASDTTAIGLELGEKLATHCRTS